MNTASLNEIAQNILNILRGGRSSNTEHLSLSQVKFAVKYWRAKLIRQDMERNANQTELFEQDLGTVEVGTLDAAESSTATAGVTVWRTNNRIPAPIRLKSKVALTHVGPPNKIDENYPVLTDARVPWQKYNKYTALRPFVVFRDGYVYVHNVNNPAKINIRGVFEDPEEVHNFTRTNGLTLYDENSAFPISIDMLDRITNSLIRGEFAIAVETLNDTKIDNLQGE